MKFQRTAILLALVSLPAGLAGCNGSDLGAIGATSDIGTTSGTPHGNHGTGPSSDTATGESCSSSDPDKLCLAIHFVSYKDSSGKAVASTQQAATIVHTMNQLWATCNIGFQIENYEAVNPADYDLAYGSQSQNQLNQIRDSFSTTNDELLAVTTGPWGTAVNAWTTMPGGGPYGAVMEASIVEYGDGIIYAHEFGHYLGLGHVSDASDLMDAIIYSSSTQITPSQCRTARSTAVSYWSAMLRT